MTHVAAQTTALAGQAQQSIGSLAVQIPGATAIFRKLKLDFCCGGQQSLATACAEKGLDAGEVLKALNALERTDEPGVVYAEGGATTVWSDYAAKKSAPLPDWLRELVS